MTFPCRKPRTPILGRKIRWLLASTGTLTLILTPSMAAAATGRATQPPPARMHVADAHALWATAAAERGAPSIRSRLAASVYPAGRNPSGLAAYALSVSTPGSKNFRPGQFTQTRPSDYTEMAACGGSVWYVEEALDIDAVHDLAPDANINYV